jgi:hypothetical protein
MRLIQCLYLNSPTMTRIALKRENYEFNRLSSLEVASRQNNINTYIST